MQYRIVRLQCAKRGSPSCGAMRRHLDWSLAMPWSHVNPPACRVGFLIPYPAPSVEIGGNGCRQGVTWRGAQEFGSTSSYVQCADAHVSAAYLTMNMKRGDLCSRRHREARRTRLGPRKTNEGPVAGHSGHISGSTTEGE